MAFVTFRYAHKCHVANSNPEFGLGTNGSQTTVSESKSWVCIPVKNAAREPGASLDSRGVRGGREGVRENLANFALAMFNCSGERLGSLKPNLRAIDST